MFFKQFSLEGLACQSYFISDAGVAAVVDPQRDVDIYLETAQAQGAQITHIIETHIHADHVSGNTELVARTGATIYLHPEGGATFPHQPFKHGDELMVGQVKLRALFTPGHTPEHICIAVTDTTRSSEPWFILTGDSLFVGDIGRPDLLGEAATKQLAHQMYHTMRELMQLPDRLEVYPGHGAGSLCGRAMSAKLSTTLGFERRFNHALQIEDESEFVVSLISDLPSQPPNVPFIKQLNREGPPVLGELKAKPLSATQAKRLLKEEVIVVDTRESNAFGAGHVKGALNVALSSNQFSTRLGFIVPPQTKFIFVARNEAECLRAMVAASRVGLDGCVGFLTTAEAKKLPQAKLAQWTPLRLNAALQQGAVTLLDVREKNEYASGHAPHAQLVPLAQLPTQLTKLPKDKPIVVMCAGGTRSSSAASLLAHEGFKEVVNAASGFDEWARAGLPIEK